MSMDAAQPKTQSYMAARMSYKPGKNKGLQRKSALELAKERADKAKEKAEKEKETAESDAEKSASDYRNGLLACQKEFDDFMNRLIWNNYKKYIKEKALDSSESEAVEAVEDTSNVGGSATLKGNEKKYQAYIDKYAAQYKLDPNLVASVITIESHWDPNARSSAQCNGLMQVNSHFVGGDLFDPETNIREGCKILRDCMNAYPESLEHALTAYNCGIAGAKNKSTSSYATKVNNEYSNRKLLAQNSSSSSGSHLNYQA